MDTQDRYGIIPGMEILLERFDKLFKTGGWIVKSTWKQSSLISLECAAGHVL